LPTHSSETIPVLIASQYPITRKGIAALLNETNEIRVVAETGDVSQIQELMDAHLPRVILVDWEMCAGASIQIRDGLNLRSVMLVLTANTGDAYLARMIDAGAAGYVSANEAGEGIVSAVQRAARGEVLFNSEQMIRARRWRETVGKVWDSMTDRERQVFRLLVWGLDNLTIAATLDVAHTTVAYHVTNILRKLGAQSRHEAIAWALKRLPSDDLNRLID
jgi:DNA-binding NarL/FixJ family response regulator